MTTNTTLAFATKSTRIGRRFLAALTLIYPVVAVAAESGLVFPADGGVLDVRAFGTKPDDDLDDTAAIQQSFDQHPSGNRIIYLPPGRWIITNAEMAGRGPRRPGAEADDPSGRRPIADHSLSARRHAGICRREAQAADLDREQPGPRFRNASARPDHRSGTRQSWSHRPAVQCEQPGHDSQPYVRRRKAQLGTGGRAHRSRTARLAGGDPGTLRQPERRAGCANP